MPSVRPAGSAALGAKSSSYSFFTILSLILVPLGRSGAKTASDIPLIVFGKRLNEASDIAMTKALQFGESFKPMIRPELAIDGGD
jgi:hypothetical protein